MDEYSGYSIARITLPVKNTFASPAQRGGAIEDGTDVH